MITLSYLGEGILRLSDLVGKLNIQTDCIQTKGSYTNKWIVSYAGYQIVCTVEL